MNETVYNPEPWVLLPEELSGDVFVDVGAGIGLWTGMLEHNFREIISIEPNPVACVEFLRRLMHREQKNAVLHAMAVGNRYSIANLYGYTDNTAVTCDSSRRDDTGSAAYALNVPVYPLDNLVLPSFVASSDRSIDLLKIDVQGKEFEVVLGASNLIQWHKPKLIVEIHHDDWGKAITESLEAWGYACVTVRHPRYEKGTRSWINNYWITGEPRTEPSTYRDIERAAESGA